jgi:hypothetical protein
MLARTGMYHFEVSRTALYRVRYVLARTSTYHLVLPRPVPCIRSRCTGLGFQMRSQAIVAASESLLSLFKLAYAESLASLVFRAARSTGGL